MKKFSLLTLLIWFCFNSSGAYASISGTVQGAVRVSENRTLPTASSDFRFVRRVVVAVTAIPAPSGPGPTVINPTFFAVTDHNGNFSSPWQDTTRNTFPAHLRVEVLWAGAANGAAGSTTRPAMLFQIGRWEVSPGSVGSPTSLFRRDVSAVNSNLGTLTAPATQETAAYLTTEGFFFNIVRHSEILRNRMPGLVVKTRVPGFNYLYGLSPFPHEVLVSENVPISNPLILAHELGHAITWAALQLGSAPINIATDYAHPSGSPGWNPLQREFSKAAFLEGLADAWAMRWAFGPDVNPVFSIGANTFRVEPGTVTNTDGTVVLNCTTVNAAHEFPFCHTVAVWDLLDSHNGGADTLTLTTANLVDTLNRFQNNCSGNGCRDELGVDALNHNDFLCNATPIGRRIAIRSVWSADGVSGGPSSFCGQ